MDPAVKEQVVQLQQAVTGLQASLAELTKTTNSLERENTQVRLCGTLH